MTGQRRYRAVGNNDLKLNKAFEEHVVQRRNVHENTKVKKDIQAQPSTRPQTMPQPKKKTGLFSTLFVIFSMFAIFSFVIARYSIICSTNNQINDLNSKIKKVQQDSEGLKADIATKLDLAKIQEKAKKDLKMDFPTAENIVYMDLNGGKDTAAADNGKKQVSKGDEKNINVLAEIVDVLQ